MAGRALIAVAAIVGFTLIAIYLIHWWRERDIMETSHELTQEEKEKQWKRKRDRAIWEDDDPDTFDSNSLEDEINHGKR